MRTTAEVTAIVNARLDAMDATNAERDAQYALMMFERSNDVAVLYDDVMALRHAPSATYVKVWIDAVLGKVVL